MATLIQMKNMFRHLIILDSTFEGGRMFVGAVSVSYLLEKGVSLSQIALLKSIQAAVFLLADFPTGVFADRCGRKQSLLVSLFLGAIGFTLFAAGKDWPIFVLAEVFTALSICFWSGAFEAYAIDLAQLNESPGLMDRFFHTSQTVNSLAVMVLGFVGGMLSSITGGLPFLVAAILFSSAALIVWWHFPNDPSRDIESTGTSSWQLLKITVKSGVLDARLMVFFVIGIVLQFVIQPILHYWQPLFKSHFGEVNATQLGFIFTLYSGTAAVAGYVYSRLSSVAFIRTHRSTLLIFVLFALCYYMLSRTQSMEIAVVLFCLAQGLLAVGRSSLTARMNERIDSSIRASILSSYSLISRIGMICALQLISVYFEAEKMQGVGDLFLLGSIITMIAVLFSFLLLRRPS